MAGAVDEQQIAAFVDALAAADGRPRPLVVWVDASYTGQATRRRGRDVITLGRGILDDAEDAYFTAAHESGHIALGHTTSRKAGAVVAAYVGSGLALALLVGRAAMLLLGPRFLSLTALGLPLWLLLQGPLLRRLKQPQETAADVYAATRGGPLTTALAGRYTARRTRAGRITAALFPIHPSWADRAKAVAPLVG